MSNERTIYLYAKTDGKTDLFPSLEPYPNESPAYVVQAKTLGDALNRMAAEGKSLEGLNLGLAPLKKKEKRTDQFWNNMYAWTPAEQNLSGVDLSRRDLSNKDLSGTNLSSATLKETLFAKSRMINTTFDNAKILSCDFSESTILGTFVKSTMGNTKFDKVTWMKASDLKMGELEGLFSERQRDLLLEDPAYQAYITTGSWKKTKLLSGMKAMQRAKGVTSGILGGKAMVLGGAAFTATAFKTLHPGFASSMNMACNVKEWLGNCMDPSHVASTIANGFHASPIMVTAATSSAVVGVSLAGMKFGELKEWMAEKANIGKSKLYEKDNAVSLRFKEQFLNRLNFGLLTTSKPLARHIASALEEFDAKREGRRKSFLSAKMGDGYLILCDKKDADLALQTIMHRREAGAPEKDVTLIVPEYNGSTEVPSSITWKKDGTAVAIWCDRDGNPSGAVHYDNAGRPVNGFNYHTQQMLNLSSAARSLQEVLDCASAQIEKTRREEAVNNSEEPEFNWVDYPHETHTLVAKDGLMRIIDRETGLLDNPLGYAAAKINGNETVYFSIVQGQVSGQAKVPTGTQPPLPVRNPLSDDYASGGSPSPGMA